MNKDPFSYYKFGFTDNPAMRGTVNSSYSLFMTIGVVGILLTLITVGIRIMSSNPSKRAEALEEIKWKALIAIVIFSMPIIISTILNFVSAFT